MKRYGQDITFGAAGAPQLFSGKTTRYSVRDRLTRQLITDEVGDNIVLVQHSRQAEISFEAKITADSTDFLDLSDDKVALTVTGFDAGVVLARRTTETWRLQNPKMASVEALWLPDVVQEDPEAAVITVSAFVPSQAGLTIVHPGGVIIYSTFGLGHASGVVHELALTQEVQLAVDDPSPGGKLLGAASHGYLRTISLLILAEDDPPAVGTVLTLTGAPARAADYRIEDVDDSQGEAPQKRMIRISAVWIPPLTVIVDP